MQEPIMVMGACFMLATCQVRFIHWIKFEVRKYEPGKYKQKEIFHKIGYLSVGGLTFEIGQVWWLPCGSLLEPVSIKYVYNGILK